MRLLKCMKNMDSVSQVCEEIKTVNPESKILILGTHPAALPERTLLEESVDFVCTGEGPLTISQLLEALNTPNPDFKGS